MAASTKPPCRRSAWPDLALDLLGDVLSRLPSLADRVRLRAVCRPWRTGAKLLPLPPAQLPWIALPDGTVLDVSNEKKHRLRPLKGDGRWYSAGENMFFVHQNDGSCCVVNGFSGAETPLPELAALLASHMQLGYKLPIMKVVMSSAESSPNHHPLVAVLVSDSWKSRVFISTCRPAGEINSCVVTRVIRLAILDIAFFQGKLYAHLCLYEELVAIDLSNCCLDKPTPGDEPEVKRFTSWICRPDLRARDFFDKRIPVRAHERYLVESNGKLLMVRKRDNATGYWFEVFEADLSDGPLISLWKKADSLDGRALFVGTPCSKSVRASEGYGARGDCIYFLFNHNISGVYSVVDKTTMPLMPPVQPLWTAKASWDMRQSPAWFFPVEV